MTFRFGEWALDRGRRELLRGQEPVPLTPKAFDLLALLLENRPRVVTKPEIHDRLWPSTFVSEVNLARLVFEIRDALSDDARKPRWIRTARGAGYAFAGMVETAAPSPREKESWCRLILPDREVVLCEGATVLGRSRDAAVWLDSTSVSRHHARIVVRRDEAVLEDLGSKNGTTVGDRAVSSPTALRDGDVVRVGTVTLRFRVVPPDDSTETAG